MQQVHWKQSNHMDRPEIVKTPGVDVSSMILLMGREHRGLASKIAVTTVHANCPKGPSPAECDELLLLTVEGGGSN